MLSNAFSMLPSSGSCILRVLGGDLMVSYVLFYVFFMIYIHFLNALLAFLYNIRVFVFDFDASLF